MGKPGRQILKPGETLDRYRLERMLGQGAVGEVWLALDEGEHGFRKRVALKVLGSASNPRRLEALMREARLSAVMNHPNIIDVFGVGQSGEQAFIVMEFVSGESLSALWRDLEFIGVRFPRSVIVDIGIAVAEALHHAWSVKDPEGKSLHVVHRDLKPANVMISDRGEVKVGDFGIAKASDESSSKSTTQVGRLKGTPSYLAPEMWEGSRDFRPAIDLWGLGVILWELAMARRFFGRASLPEIYDSIQARNAKEEAAELQSYFPELVPIVQKLLQRDADDRHQSGFELAEELRRVKAHLGPSGDLMQFVRLVRAGRLDPEERTGSLLQLPVLPVDRSDWDPLVSVAAGDYPEPLQGGEPPSTALQDDKPVVIGPETDPGSPLPVSSLTNTAPMVHPNIRTSGVADPFGTPAPARPLDVAVGTTGSDSDADFAEFAATQGPVPVLESSPPAPAADEDLSEDPDESLTQPPVAPVLPPEASADGSLTEPPRSVSRPGLAPLTSDPRLRPPMQPKGPPPTREQTPTPVAPLAAPPPTRVAVAPVPTPTPVAVAPVPSPVASPAPVPSAAPAPSLASALDPAAPVLPKPPVAAAPSPRRPRRPSPFRPSARPVSVAGAGVRAPTRGPAERASAPKTRRDVVLRASAAGVPTPEPTAEPTAESTAASAPASAAPSAATPLAAPAPVPLPEPIGELKRTAPPDPSRPGRGTVIALVVVLVIAAAALAGVLASR